MKGKRDKQIILGEKKNDVVWKDICLVRYDRKLFTSQEWCRIASVESLKNTLRILRSSLFVGDHGWRQEEGSHTQVWQPFLLQFRDVFSLRWEDKGGSKNAGDASAGSGCAPCPFDMLLMVHSQWSSGSYNSCHAVIYRSLILNFLEANMFKSEKKRTLWHQW